MSVDEYVVYLMSNISRSGCVKAGQTLQVSHAVDRFLTNAQYTLLNSKDILLGLLT